MAEKDEPGQTLPSLEARSSSSSKGPPGEELPFEQPGRYTEITRELGHGGLGRVLLVRDAHLEREVAVKELHSHLQARSDSVAHAVAERFLREARITASLEHPGVVPVYELAKRNDGSLFYAMKQVQGQTLAKAIAACGTLDERLSLLPHLLDVVQTVAYAHTRTVVHRDLKPENVMVGAFGETQVVDWGLARAAGMPMELPAPATADAPLGNQTLAGQAIGTPRYMSPEQARGEVEKMDAQSDVWSLGVMLFELLTGRTPFDRTTNAQLLGAVLGAPIPKVTALEPKAPRALVAVVEQSLQRDRGLRYPSAVEMAEALGEALGAHAEATRRPLGWMLAAAALALASAVATVAWFGARGEVDEARAKAERVGSDEARAHALALAERAQAAWDDGDVFLADQLAGESAGHAELPLALGVQALVKLSGAPRKSWSTTVAGGCTALVAADETVACATLGGVQLFDAATGGDRGLLSTGPVGWQRALVFLDKRTLASGGDDKVVRLWNVEEKKLLRDYGAQSAQVLALAASSDGATLFSGNRDGAVLSWPREGGAPTELSRHPAAVRALAVTDSELASTARDSTWVRSLAADRPLLLQLDRPAAALRFSRAGLVAAVEREVVVLAKFAPPLVAGSHLDELTALGGSTAWELISAGNDRHLRGWANGRPVARLSAFASPVTAIASRGELVFVATRARTVEAWAWPRDARAPLLPQLGLEPTAAVVDSEGFTVGLRDGSFRRLVGERNALDVEGERHAAPVRALAAAKGASISVGDDGAVLWWKAGGRAELLERNPGTRGRAVAVSADGERAAWSFDDGLTVLWSLKFGKEINRERDTPALALAFSPDGAVLAQGREDKAVVLLDAVTGKPLRRLVGHDGAVASLAFSPDGRLLASGAADHRVLLWDVASGREQVKLQAARDRVGSLAFSADGARLAVGADDGAVYLWQVAGAKLTSELRLHAGDVLVVGFSPDGRLLVMGTDRTARWLRL